MLLCLLVYMTDMLNIYTYIHIYIYIYICIYNKNPSTFVYPQNLKLIHKYLFETDISMFCNIFLKVNNKICKLKVNTA